jgi:hypothetical protein
MHEELDRQHAGVFEVAEQLAQKRSAARCSFSRRCGQR